MRAPKLKRNKGFINCILLTMLFMLAPALCAADFTAKAVADYGNITVIEVSGNYDAKNADGTINSLPREIIAKEFFKTHKDEYDFIVIFTNFDFNMPDATAKAFYTGVKNDIRGIGQPMFDYSQQYGSAGKLQGTIDAGNLLKLVLDPLDPNFENTLFVVGHEYLHRWGAYVKFKDKDGNISSALLGKDGAHWSFLLDTSASVLYGNKWQDNGDGTFTSVQVAKYLSPLDLYLMGFANKSQVPQMMLIDNPEVDATQMPRIGAKISGTAKYVTIDDIIAAEGERTPNNNDAPKSFKTAFILITTPGGYTSEQLHGLENLRNAWITRFSLLTDGQGIMSVTPTLLPNIPTNPGIPPVPETIRTLPPSIEAGVTWLMGTQLVDGNWQDIQQTNVRDTSEVVNIIGKFDIATQNYASGLKWLNNMAPGNTDYLARKIYTLASSGQDTAAFVTDLIALQNSDGGWGSDKGYSSNAVDTALALRALSAAGVSNQEVVSKAINYLKSTQNSDGGWGAADGISAIEVTANALSALNKYSGGYQVADNITKGQAMLISRQNEDGSFGSGKSIYETAIAVLALNELNAPTESRNRAIAYILSKQAENGSWKQSPYQTALAVNAVYRATVTPDLSVRAEDIQLIPATISSIPANVTLQASIANLGRTTVQQARVAIYDGAVAPANKIAEQVAAFPGQTTVTLTFQITIADGKEHRFYVVADPDNLISESNKTNNSAVKVVGSQTSYDFEALASEFSVSPAAVDLYQEVTITSKIRNNGTTDAYNVQVKYYIDDPQGAVDIATSTINIPAGATVTNQITWKASKGGENMPLTVQVDPFNLFSEISKTNNRAVTSLTVRGSTDANLSISYKDILVSPTTINERGNATITATVKNTGFAQVANVKVNFFKGTPGVDGVLLGSGTIDSLNAGESKQVSYNWTNISDSGERIIYVQVDPDNQIKEITKEDNNAFVTVNILSLPDLAVSTNSISFSPSAPKDGDTVGITVMVQNSGAQSVSNVTVRAFESGNTIGTQVIPAIAGNAQGSVSFAYDTSGKKGPHQISVVVDPDNQIIEQSKDNNSASRTIGVQDANLWVTEQYFSPNGDGVKDSAQFFFRLASPQTVKIVVSNKKGEAVRTFNSADLTTTSGGNITWDGLNDEGMVVPDGQYQISIDSNGASLGSQLVIVDTNRSPITEAIGTKYLLNTNLTCMLPDIQERNWKWLPDESSIIAQIGYVDSNTPEYSAGLYALLTSGDVQRLTPTEWGLAYNDTNIYYSITRYDVSPSGNRIALALNKYDKIQRKRDYQIWTLDRDGGNLTMVMSIDGSSGNTWIDYVKWTSDSASLFYVKGSPYEFRVVQADGSGDRLIGSETGYIEIDDLKWSPDGSRLAYVNYPSGGNQQLVAIDMNGTRQVLLNSDVYLNDYEWFGNQNLLYGLGYGRLWLLSANGQTGTVRLYDSSLSEDVAISPDKKYVAYVVSDTTSAKLQIADAEGNVEMLYERTPVNAGYTPDIGDIVWSPDGKRVAFVESEWILPQYSEFRKIDQVYLSVVDRAGKSRAFYRNPPGDLSVWLSDGNTILSSRSGYTTYGELQSELRGQRADSGEVLPILKDVQSSFSAAFDLDKQHIISPLERYIAYYKTADSSSVCYNRGTDDLWALSSLLNLTANLQIKKEQSGIVLKGVAADMNFEGYKIEYADIRNPQQWNPVAPPSEVPVLSEVFTTWIPPADGVYYVQLTVWDKAGNRAIDRKRVSWGITSSITNVYTSSEIFSPNGDGVKDTVALNYTVLEPAHLEFNVYDEKKNLIRTFRKEHTGYATDYIAWDGRNESGTVVPDGIYSFKVFDFEFFVEVDNIPPDSGASYARIVQFTDVSDVTDPVHLNLYIDLKGHAQDKNIKTWRLEEGAGDNPTEWQELSKGEDQIGMKDQNGNFVSPGQDVKIRTVWESNFGDHIGNKLRISVDDQAGNRSTQMSEFVEEKFVLYRWAQGADSEKRFLLDKDLLIIEGPKNNEVSIPYDVYSKPGVIKLGGVFTMRAPIASMNVQYRNATGWTNYQPVNNASRGVFEILWDNPGVRSGSVRVRAVDVYGQEYFSNEIKIGDVFSLKCINDLECPIKATIETQNSLLNLSFSVQSPDDSRYATSFVYRTFDISRGDTISSGTFCIPLPETIANKRYIITMSGEDSKGNKYTSVLLSCEMSNDGDIAIGYGSDENCNQLSKGMVTLNATFGARTGQWQSRTLAYYIKEGAVQRLLGSVDLQTNQITSINIDTLGLAQGSYEVTAVLTYLDYLDSTLKEARISRTLTVDRTPPVAQITYPAKSQTICPVTSTDGYNWFGIPIEGEASDNISLKKYEVFFGVGQNPSVWEAAKTRLDGKVSVIAGNQAKKGKLGTWDVSALKGVDYSLRLKAVDGVGNTTCTVTTFSIDRVVEIAALAIDKDIFSPNADGVMDDININYTINKYATVDVRIFRLLRQNDEYVPDTTSLRTITSGLRHLGGAENIKWDGRDDAGQVLPDGMYAIKVFAKDSCGNTNSKWTGVEIDNTPPITIISYPRPPDQLGNIVEVKGTADDPNFGNYILEAGAGENPGNWQTVSSGSSPVKENILGEWNTSELSGKWTLRLTSSDTVGNKRSVSTLVDLGQRKALIKDLSAAPQLFSPNNDGRSDSSTISYTLTDACQIKIDIVDSSSVIRRTYTVSAPSVGTYTYIWDGKDNSGSVVTDGAYTVRLSAALASNPSVTQEETITIVVDATAPVIDVKSPAANAYVSGDLQIFGSIADVNLTSYSMIYTGASGAVQVDSGALNREGYIFGTLSGLAEGSYTLNVTATDKAGNNAERNIVFTIDRTAPKVTMDSPKEGEVYGISKGVISVTGAIVENNLDTYSVRYGAGDNPAQWTELSRNNTIPTTSQLFSWRVGRNDGIPDGVYTLSLYAKDKAGLTGEVKVKVTIDNTLPEVSITAPRDNDYVTKALDIRGTAYDLNIDKYTLELSEGICAAAYKWATIKTSTSSVRDGTLHTWQALPADGDYCLRLTATDKLGNKSEVKVNIKINTQPPAAPQLTGKIENKNNARLSWSRNGETDIAGYNLYRDAVKINATVISDISYLDQNLKEASYSYTVTAVDLAGNESKPSNEVKLKIDLTGPEAKLRIPQNGARVGGLIDIKGTANSSDDFKQYRVYIGQGSAPASWNLIRTSPVPVTYGSLAQWDTLSLSEGQFSIKLEAEDISGNVSTDQVIVTIDNTPPATPVLISATPNVSDVTLTWRANTEPDLAGYLVYRNDQLVNATSVVIGDLKPYLINATTYLNKSVPDGKVKYYVVAMDQAGNLSGQSNTIEVNLDTHAPRATIVDPKDKDKIQDKILVRAESPDIDIASVQFQYKKSTDAAWVNLGTPVTLTPYINSFDPKTLQLAYADYQLRAIATDKNSKTDTAPPHITITYTDLTPANAPKDLKALTNGQDVSLTWQVNTESDIAGYNVYRTSAGMKSMITSSPVTVASYQDKGLSDGEYSYEVTAMDSYGNESKASNSVSAKVYAPKLNQPYTPSAQKAIELSGSGAVANNTVELFDEVNSIVASIGSTTADGQGNFSFAQANLTLGENKLTVTATDGSGNISRASDLIVVVYNEAPAAPKGLASAVNGYIVNLTWNPNSESDLSGYNIYRDGVKLNKSSAVTAGTATASSVIYPNLAPRAFDSNTSTYWMSTYSNGAFTPAWWQISMTNAELISRVEIQWRSVTDSEGNETIYAGKDFEIQVWSGYAWITQKKITGNIDKSNAFDFSPSYRTNKIRVYITDTTDTKTTKQVGITEVRITKDNLVTDTSYTEADVKDGSYSYKATAVDYYGFESQPSDEAKTSVGDVVPPSPPQNLRATALGSNIALNWDRNSETDVVGYNVYRKGAAQVWAKLNAAVVVDNIYSDNNLANGSYTYRVTAVDSVGNESLPSNEASAQIGVELPQPPNNLTVTVVTGGGSLNIAWDHPGSPAGYNLYRSMTRGGPYAKINSALLGSRSYADSGLTNGVTYYYVSVAVDTLGNESAYSNEGSGAPNDSVAPVKPVLYYPTIAGRSVTVYQDTTDIAGTAEAGAAIDLFKNGFSSLKTEALKTDKILNFATEKNIDWAALSPDAKILAYLKDEALWLKDLASGDTQKISDKGDYPVWSPDGRKLAYAVYDSNWVFRLNIYDVKKKTSVSLTSDQNVNEVSPSWTYDGRKLAFISDRDGEAAVWIRDIASDTLPVKVGSGYNPLEARISPDGRRVAYFDETSSLSSIEIGSGEVTLIDDKSDGYTAVWSADGARLLNLSNRSGNFNVYVYELGTKKTTQITSLTKDAYDAAWSPDGAKIALSAYIDSSNMSVSVVPADGSGSAVILKPNAGNVVYLGWMPSGGIAYLNNSGLTVQYPAGMFTFSNVPLGEGETLFYAVAGDASGNISQPSGEISVVYNSDQAPDIAVSADGISVFPAAPIAGQKVNITAAVKNLGQEARSNVEVAISLMDEKGVSTLMKSDVIPLIAAKSEVTVTAEIDTTGKNGVYQVIVNADPNNLIDEADETNNKAVREFVVMAQEGVRMIASLDASEYKSSQDVAIRVDLSNSGADRAGIVETRIEDSNGQRVSVVDSRAIQLPYASHQNYGLTWNTGATYAGNYRLHTVFRNSSGALISEHSVPFAILPDSAVDVTLTTDKISYASNENVVIETAVKSLAKNYIISDITARVNIMDSAGNVLFTEMKNISSLLPGGSSTLGYQWNTALNASGDYRVSVDVSASGKAVATKTAVFRISPTTAITGSVGINPAVIVLGSSGTVSYSIRNEGNSGITGLPLRIVVVDPDSQTVTVAHETTVDLAGMESKSGSFALQTVGYALKTYAVVFQYSAQGSYRTVASGSFSVRDGSAPVVNIISPLAGTVYNGRVSLAVTATDNAIGIDKVEYRIDNGDWKILPQTDAAYARFGINWLPVSADEGSHSISFRATDKAGNTSSPVSTSLVVDMTAPQPPQIITPADNSTVMTSAVDIRGVAEPGSVVIMAGAANGSVVADAASGAFTFSAVNLASAVNSFVFTSTDKAGNISAARSYVLNYMPLSVNITANITTDKLIYRMNEVVNIAANVQNQGVTLDGLTAQIAVLNSAGQILSTENKAIGTLATNQSLEIKSSWNTLVNPKGAYTVKISVIQSGSVLNLATAGLTILGTSETGDGLTGTISAQPNSIYQGQDINFMYTVRNQGNEDIGSLTIRVAVIDAATSEVLKTFENTTSLALNMSSSGNFSFGAVQLPQGQYKAVLKASTAAMSQPVDLGNVTFEMKAAIQVTRNISRPVNLLVWVNSDCHRAGDGGDFRTGSDTQTDKSVINCDGDDKCVHVDLLKRIFADAAISYHIVYEKKDFQTEMRNPIYTDMLILGEKSPLEDHYSVELREQVYGGKGLISSLFTKHGSGSDYEGLLGVDYSGHLGGSNRIVSFVKSPISAVGTMAMSGSALDINAKDTNNVVAWFIGAHKGSGRACEPQEAPAIVLNEYGLGRTVYFAFDLGVTLNEQNYERVSALIRNSITYVHRATDGSAVVAPNQFVPVELTIKSLGGVFDIRLTETYSAGLQIYDIPTGSWVKDNPWIKYEHLGAGASIDKTLYVYAPDKIGVYTLNTEIAYLESGSYVVYVNTPVTLSVEKDTRAVCDDIIASLTALNAGKSDRNKIYAAIGEITNVRNRVVRYSGDVEKNIRDTREAIDLVRGIVSIDLKQIRLKMDRLLESCEADWYMRGN
jgi:large repetitive protein